MRLFSPRLRPDAKCSRSGVALVLVALASPAAAFQSTAILGQDDGVFARRLREAGYDDLAHRLCEMLASPENLAGATSEERLDIESLELEFDLDAARREPDLLARKAAIELVLEEKRAFVDGNANTSAGQIARDAMPDDLRLLAETITSILKEQELDSGAAATLREEGLGLFQQAEQELGERVARSQLASREEGAEAEAALRQLELDLFNLGRTRYFKSMLYAPEDPRRKEALDEAIETFEEFGLEFPDNLNSFAAAVYEGLSYRDAGNVRRALDAFDAAIALREAYLPLPDGRFDVTPEAADLISQAVLQKVLLLGKEGRHDEAGAAAEDFFQTIPDAWAANLARRVAIQQAEELLQAGRAPEALGVAERIVNVAPDTPEGRRASEMLSSASPGALDPAQLLRVAGDQVVRGELDRSIATLRKALDLCRGAGQQDDVISTAYDLIGVIYVRQGRPLEAAVAFDAGVELAPEGARAPDILYKAANHYFDLAAKEKRPYFRKRALERMQRLAEKYPTHPLAVKVVIGEGKALEADEKWAEAAQRYERVDATSKVYEEAQFRLGLCTYRSALTRAAGGKIDAAAVDEARRCLARARAAAETRAAQTLDAAEQRELSNIAFQALALETEILLASGRTTEAESLLELAESQDRGQAQQDARVRSLRLEILLQQAKFEEAIQRFDAAALSAPDDPSNAAGAFRLAVALDGAAEQTAGTDAPRAEKLRREAARYYVASARPALEGKAVLDLERLDEVADRLLALGMQFNGLPDAVDTFVDWEGVDPKGGSPRETAAWDSAAEIYAHELSQSPSARRRIQLGRALGLLGRYGEAAETYAPVFDTNQVIVRDGGQVRVAPEIAKNNPEIVAALLEYAVAEHRAGVAAGDANRLHRSAQIISDLALALKGSAPDSRLFWQLKFAQARSLADRGLYSEADLLVDDLQRTTDDFDRGKFGYREKFLKVREELNKKVLK